MPSPRTLLLEPSRVAMLVAATVVATTVVATSRASAQSSAGPRSCLEPRLPLYSHNDYRSPRPLFDAVEAGFRGVEVDVFLVDGELRAGHSAREARRGPRLEDAYLRPLDSLSVACRWTSSGERPRFLLLLEVKEVSPATHDSLLALLRRHERLFVPAESREPAVEVALVGWTPPFTPPIDDVGRALLRPQHRMRSPGDTVIPHDGLSHLVSVDYGKTMGRWWTREASRRRWLASIRSIKRRHPRLLVRAHNVPADSAVMAMLFDARVDVIGATDVARFAQLMEHLSPSAVYERP